MPTKEAIKRARRKYYHRHPEQRRHGYWRAVIIRFLGEVCVFCGTKENLTLDHIIELSKGGADEMNNLRVLCSDCHGERHGTTIHTSRSLVPRKDMVEVPWVESKEQIQVELAKQIFKAWESLPLTEDLRSRSTFMKGKPIIAK